jgi:hypothetical protein
MAEKDKVMEYIQVIDYLPKFNSSVLFKTRWTGETLNGLYNGSRFISSDEKEYDPFLDVTSWRYKYGM